MKPEDRFLSDMLDMETPKAAHDILWIAGPVSKVSQKDGEIIATIPFSAFRANIELAAMEDQPDRQHLLRLRCYEGGIVRLSFDPADSATTPHEWLLDQHSIPHQLPLHTQVEGALVHVLDSQNIRRADIHLGKIAEAVNGPQITLYPDGQNPVELMAWDRFLPHQPGSLTIAYVERDGITDRTCFSIKADAHEHFCGTGERFAPLDLAGRTLLLENRDALGVNNRRAYKNVPFYISSQNYGLLILTTASIRLSLADISTRAVQATIQDPFVDLFFLGGNSLASITQNYRALTGIPPEVPKWSFGLWMGRMTYLSAEEVEQIAARMRKEHYPCDVMHIDTGWFERDWFCDWTFSPTRFPNHKQFLKRLRDQGYRVTLWQLPRVGVETTLFADAKRNGYLSKPTGDVFARADGSNFGASKYEGTIDLTNPKAVAWYQGMLEKLLRDGVAAIKTDFGEEIDSNSTYHAMPPRLLHNAYALLYQKMVFELTQRITGNNITYARSGWAGAQKYPVHWPGDAASTWDGLSATVRGGLHLGLSGFAYWSHDVGGFHGTPDFKKVRPSDELLVRWTQAGVFTSHMRYHGANPREPYEFPAVSDILRTWLRLRYAIIPYLVEQSRKCIQTGLPMLRAMVFHHADDDLCWRIDDQYYFGDDFLVAPLFQAGGVRNIYLPAGDWINFWTGEHTTGPIWLKNVQSPLHQMPLFVRKGAQIEVYPDPVECTDQMQPGHETAITFDSGYRGIAHSVLGPLLQLEQFS